MTKTQAALGDRYHLDARIATGGMGEVWQATDSVLGRIVAIKVLRREYADDATFLERFRAEARNMALLAHPGIAQVFDFGETPVGGATVPYIVMELVPGQPLSAMIGPGRTLDPEQALDLVEQTALALHAAHEAGVVHRDVKPANLLVTPDGVVKVTDFGIARAADALPLTRSGTVMGTAHYLAPELADGTGKASPASDVYALGVVLYECLAGQRPFQGANPVKVALAHVQQEPPELPAHVPDPVRRLVQRVLAKDPANRPASAREFARRCAAVRRGLSDPDADDATAALAVAVAPDATALMTAPLRRDQQRTRGPRRPGTRLTAALALALVVLLLGGWLLTRDGEAAVVPKLTGQSAAAAEAALRAAGFTGDFRGEVNRSVPKGVVSKQSVSPGRRLAAGSVLRVFVSTGPPTVQVRVSEWRGRAYAEVVEELGTRGLVVRLRFATANAPPGTVADVTPDGAVPVGETVTVTVARAPVVQDGERRKGKGSDQGSGKGSGKGEDE